MSRNRPAGIAFIAIWYFLNGLGTLASSAAPLFALDLLNSIGFSGALPLVGAIITFLFTIGYMAAAWGLWELRDWARMLTMALAGIGLILGLTAAVILLFGVEIGGINLSMPGLGMGFLVGAIINGLIIYYLMRPEIQELFGGGGWEEPPLPTPYPPTPYPPTPLPPTPPISTSTAGAGRAAPSIDATRPLHEPEPVVGWLVVRSGARANDQLKLRASSNTVGRDGRKCELVLDDSSVSGEHAKIRWENGVFTIYDLASTNGTFVNGRRVEKQRLMDNDLIRMGHMELVFKQIDPRHRRAN